jgi:integrase
MSNANATRAQARPPRRIKSSKPGIYYRQDAGGRRRYEYVYRDAARKQRWVGGFHKIADAEDDRAEKLRRTRRGERIAPLKSTVVDFAEQWLVSQSQLRPSTRARYEWAIRRHIAPQFGRLKLGEITEDHVVCLVADMTRKGYRPATIKAVLAPLSLVLGRAVRRGALSSNAVSGLERSERPRGQRRDMRILKRDEIAQLIEATAAEHRPLMATLVFCGFRISEALGLVWADVDLDGGQIRLRAQLDHSTRRRVEPKTGNAVRGVVRGCPELCRS